MNMNPRPKLLGMSSRVSTKYRLLRAPSYRLYLNSTEHRIMQSLHIPLGLLEALPVLLPLLIRVVVCPHLVPTQRTRVCLWRETGSGQEIKERSETV